MNKQQIRQEVFRKYNGKCAYCGCELQKGWHVDHIVPKFRNWDEQTLKGFNRERGKDTISNYNPSCPRCNKWKSTLSIEEFRREISMQIERLKRDSPSFRMALDYGLIKETETKVKFYFETF